MRRTSGKAVTVVSFVACLLLAAVLCSCSRGLSPEQKDQLDKDKEAVRAVKDFAHQFAKVVNQLKK